MVRSTTLLIAALAVTAFLAFSGEAPATDFVGVNNLQFEVAGQTVPYVGASYFNAMNLAADPANRPLLDAAFAGLQDLGVTNVRIWASSEGTVTANRLTPTLQPEPGVYSDSMFEGLDYVLKSAAEHNLRCVMVLNNSWNWSGGMNQYVDWSPNTPTDVVNWSWEQGPRHDLFYTDSWCQDTYRDFLDTLINRANTQKDGLLYKDDPAIFAWELANEPRAHVAGQTVLTNWIDATAQYIKAQDANHMVTTGSEGFLNKTNPTAWWERSDQSGTDFVANHSPDSIDYATVHIWPWNWSWYPEQTSSIDTMEEMYARASAFLQDHIASAQNDLAKPLALEEFGLLRDGDHDGNGSEPPGSPTTERDALFQFYFDMLYASAAAGGPAMGSNFWTYNGDPPQEPMGMYSVFDPEDNSTLAIIAAEAARMAGLAPVRGDANGDGKVDGADLNAWQNNYDPLGLNQNDWSMGDWNGDGYINGADLALWQANYDPLGLGSSSLGSAPIDGIPEPATAALIGCAAAFLAAFRRRRAQK